ncbi:MAG: hypothetical protein AAF597_19640 [Bacteroidota bacterium]
MTRILHLSLLLFPTLLLASSPPANDDFADATVITSTPFTDEVAAADASEATFETDEPVCQLSEKSYWYTYTPTETGTYRLAAEITGRLAAEDENDIVLAGYSGDGYGNLSELDCADEDNGYGGGEVLFFELTAGVRYNFRVVLLGSNTSTDVITTSLERVTEVTWQGSVSDDWSEAGNWSGGQLPTATDIVTIDDSAANPCVIRSTGGGAFAATAREVYVDNQAFTISAGSTLSTTRGDDGVKVEGTRGSSRLRR